MRQDGKTNKQTATELEITKLSTVKNPAHAPALAAIIKSVTESDEEENVIKQSFMEAMAEITLEEQTDLLMNSIWDSIWALRKSIRNTMSDSDVTNKKEVIQNNISDFATNLSSVIASTNVIKTGGQDMKKDEIQAMLKKAVDPLKDELGIAKSIIKMSSEVRKHFDTLTDEEKADFLKKSTEDQEAVVKSIADAMNKSANDETAVIEGQTVVKSEVGAAVFSILKSQQTRIDKGQEDIVKERQARELIEFTKQAEGMYPNLPGESAAKGKVMKYLADADTDVRETLTGMLKAGNEGIEVSKAFDELGSSTVPVGGGTPLAKLNKMAEDKAAEDSITFAKAYNEVLETPEGAALYEKTLKK